MLASERGNAGRVGAWGEVSVDTKGVQLTDEQRIDWLRLIRSPNVGPRGIMQQSHQTVC